MREISKDLRVNKHFVTSYGSIGKCFSCEQASKVTAEINGNRYCQSCATEDFPENKTAKFEETDAKFKCYATGKNGCGSDQLSYREFYVGTCCENAANFTEDEFKYETAAIVNDIYEEIRKEEGTAEKEAENASKKVKESKKKMEEAKKMMENAKKMMEEANGAFEEAKKESENSKEELIKTKAFRKKVQKRALILTKDAMKEDNSDAESDEPEAKKPKRGGENYDRSTCKVCLEVFDEDRHKAILSSCGHAACFNCLSILPKKTCPICRKKFTKRNIIKIYD